ncbi:MAG: glycosyltransferase [Flavobacteriaceae bacterium]|nr:glycosyltransferase [Flavobacteriaceae bacterium]
MAAQLTFFTRSKRSKNWDLKYIYTLLKAEIRKVMSSMLIVKRFIITKEKKSSLQTFSYLPYIVSTRASRALLKNLKTIKAPILFEGLHSTFPLFKHKFDDRIILVRTHNIEHAYYKGLASSETNFMNRLFFYAESFKLKLYEKVLKRADYILPISLSDHAYFQERYKVPSILIPPFHANKLVRKPSKKGYFALYHGDLKVPDNQKAVEYLYKVFKSVDYPLVIAGNLDYSPIDAKTCRNKKISFIQLENDEQLMELFKRAHVNVLPTFQNTGIKLKLINSLFNSRFCLCHPNMVKGTGLENLCVEAKSKSEFIKQMYRLMEQEYSEEDIAIREHVLEDFKTEANARTIKDLIF